MVRIRPLQGWDPGSIPGESISIESAKLIGIDGTKTSVFQPASPLNFSIL